MESFLIRILILFSLLINFTLANANTNTNQGSFQDKSIAQESNSAEDDIENEFDDMENEFENEFETKKELIDPLEAYNRTITSFNDFTYLYVIDPVSEVYRYVIPEELRFCTANFFNNLSAPSSALNNLLQGKFKQSLTELTRFVLNTTLGIGGLGDFSKEVLGIEKHQEDFGQTLGFYGVGRGFPIVLPLLGPSNLRDVTGYVGDYFTNPKVYLDNIPLSLGLSGYEKLNLMSLHVRTYKEMRKNAIDLYPFLQNFYEQYRQKQISE